MIDEPDIELPTPSPIPPARLVFSAADRAAVCARIDESLRSGRLTLGPVTSELETMFGSRHGLRRAVATASGTSALEIIVRALGVEGCEVVVPTNTFFATAAAVVHAGGSVRLADVEPATFALSAAALEASIGPRTVGAIVVHIGGMITPEIDDIRRLCDQRGIWLVEDAAHAHGADLDGRTAGTFGRAAAFSFYPTKNLGALGDAGVVTTDDPAVADRLRAARGFGLHGPQSRLDTVQAALLLAKLPHLERWNARRRELADRYRGALRVEVPPDDDGHVYHLFVARVPERDRVRRVLADRGVETAVHYAPAIHRRWPSLARESALAASERAAETVLSLPLYPQLSDDEADEVIASFAGV